ncbi:MAG: hypothetical protein FWG87_10820 [Defluviitaleaceae bacterium]|nr:hypothetical protein [Defluviitaleaceae bacterium]
MENNETPKKNNEDFYAVVSAIARFIETADDDLERVGSATVAEKKRGLNE